MTNKNGTKRAFLMSLLSLVLCLSMLVGTTFAWFTDEVKTGMNIIAAGNLDVELLADGVKVDSATKLFDDVALWEPGVVVYENLQVANVGTLALKYRLKLNFGKENNLNGHKLSEVLKIAIIDKVDANATRQDVLKAAKDAVAADKGLGALSNFYVNGELLPGASSTEQTVVIFWEPGENDNLYNVNNGQSTSDGEPLHIEFGVTLEATQMMHENDSFDNTYDEFATILPQATVNNLGVQTITATMGIGGATQDLELPFTMQFQPNEQVTDPDGVPNSGDEYLDSAYRYWHADFVVKADKDVPENSMALAGYYNEWCQYNNDYWVALTADQLIAAGTEIRLVQGMANGFTVNYEEICKFGNDGIGFLCSAIDLTGANAGTTLTVELRLYETTIDPSANSGSANIETGKFVTVGTYTYTFGSVQVGNATDLAEKLAAGYNVQLADDIDLGATQITVPAGKDVVLDLNGHNITGKHADAGHYAMFTIPSGASLTINGQGQVTANTEAQESNRSLALFLNAGKLTINGGTYNLNDASVDKTWILAAIVDNRTNNASCEAVLTINGGDFSVSGNAKNLFRNYPQQGGTATIIINDGAFHANDGQTTYIWNQESRDYPGKLYFYGGTFDANVVYEDYNGQSDVYIAPGVTIQPYSGNT